MGNQDLRLLLGTISWLIVVARVQQVIECSLLHCKMYAFFTHNIVNITSHCDFQKLSGGTCPQCPLVSMHATTACDAMSLTTLFMLPMALYLQTLCIMYVKKQYQV